MEKELLVSAVREQTQEDIRSYLDSALSDCFAVGFGTAGGLDTPDTCAVSLIPRDKLTDELCQIIVDNFKKLEE